MLRPADDLDRRVKVVERLLLDDRGDVGGNAATAHRFLHDDGAVGLGHRFEDRFLVERHQRARVDNLGLDAGLSEFVRRLQRARDHVRPGDEGDVLARPLDVGLAEFDDVLAVRHQPLGHVEVLVLQEHYRIVLAQRVFEQALGVGGHRGHHHLEAGYVVK